VATNLGYAIPCERFETCLSSMLWRRVMFSYYPSRSRVRFKCCFNRELFKINILMCRYVISSYLSWLIIPLVSKEFSFETLLCPQFSVVHSFVVLLKTNSELRVIEER
jgi:hypothetical protein